MYKSFIYSNDRLGINLNALKDEEGKIWFIGKEVAEVLGYKDTPKAIQRHIKKENHKRKITNNDIDFRVDVLSTLKINNYGAIIIDEKYGWAQSH